MITEEMASAPALVAGESMRDGPWADRMGPYLRRVVSRAVAASPADVTRASRYARDAARAVARIAPAARADVLDRAARLAAERRDRLAALLALELGKPVKDGRGEIDRVADTLAVCAAEARRIGGELLPVAGLGPRRGKHRTDLPGTGRGRARDHAVQRSGEPAGAQAGRVVRRREHHHRQVAAAGARPAPRPSWSCCSTPACPPRPSSCCTAAVTIGAQLCAAEEVAAISFTGSAGHRHGGGAGRGTQAPGA